MTDGPTFVVVAGGLGTRVRHIPGAAVKVLAPVHGEPFLALLLRRLRDLDAGHVHLCLGHGAGAVLAEVARLRPPMRVTTTVEDAPLGVFGAVRLALDHLSDPFVLGYGDVLPSARPAGVAASLTAGTDGVVVAWENAGAGEPSNLLVRDGGVVAYGRDVPGATYLDVGTSAFRRAVVEPLRAGEPVHERDVLGPLAARGALGVFEVGGPSAQIGDPDHYDEVVSIPPGGLDRPAGLPPLLLLDREGVLLRHVDPYVLRSEDVRPVPGAFAAAAALARVAGRLAVVTNQSPVARGLATREFVDRTNGWLVDQLSAHGAPDVRVYVCPHDDAAGCDCRKPRPGLLVAAARDAGVDPRETWIVGDHDVDLDAGLRAGCPVRVHARSGRSLRPSAFATHVVPDLAALAALVAGATS